MDWKTILIRLAGLLVICVGGSFLLALTVNLMIMMEMMPRELEGQGFGYAVLNRTSYIFMGSALIGLAGVFLKPRWRHIFYFSPLYAPTVFAVGFTIFKAG
jgi:hypothetical protein